MAKGERGYSATVVSSEIGRSRTCNAAVVVITFEIETVCDVEAVAGSEQEHS